MRTSSTASSHSTAVMGWWSAEVQAVSVTDPPPAELAPLRPHRDESGQSLQVADSTGARSVSSRSVGDGSGLVLRTECRVESLSRLSVTAPVVTTRGSPA